MSEQEAGRVEVRPCPNTELHEQHREGGFWCPGVVLPSTSAAALLLLAQIRQIEKERS
jgi:hypothetical protein